eukprot:CAMPEP_0176420438 /NCGR_PEP_ID=MMETSP0127-20121128/8607_1 /TAXON_ID=938130 /ORGANISM="Platyophrya macrostoma, Strain WH" /LENGTH=217 /DNA_ID=CAMNT_0017801035 /DNA_START=426 /DNA_END=1079 /DNA_ORIENTATION=+
MYKCSLIKHIKVDHQITSDPAKYLTVIAADEAANEEEEQQQQQPDVFEPQLSKKIFTEAPTSIPQFQQPVIVQLPAQITPTQLLNHQPIPVQQPVLVHKTLPLQSTRLPMNMPMNSTMARQSQQPHGCDFIRVKDYLNFINAQKRVAMAQNIMHMYSSAKVFPQNYTNEAFDPNSRKAVPMRQDETIEKREENVPLVTLKSEIQIEHQTQFLKKEEF